MIEKNNFDLKNDIILINSNIHKKAKLSRKDFLEKTKNIKFIRTCKNSNYISFYITSLKENNNLIKFHSLVNKGEFDFNDSFVFAVALKPLLHNWFKTTKLPIIQKQIACWLAGYYFTHPTKRQTISKQIYQPLFDEVLKIFDHYFKKLDSSYSSTINNLNEIDTELIEQKYLKLCKNTYGKLPPEIFKSPFNHEILNEWGTNEFLNFEFIEAYFTISDWERIIKHNSNDDLFRVESNEELWSKWLHTYSTFDLHKNYEYHFFFEPNSKRKSSSLKKRDIIPQETRQLVWERDNGRCVYCDSNENIEFDHIIPISKGGSSSEKNIQLLCRNCNRKKYNKI
jgi:hypothetical protein